MKRLQKSNGFTLVELVLCIAIVGMLTAAIAPSFGSLLTNSARTAAKGTAGAVQSAINVKVAENILNGSAVLYPPNLDDDTAATWSCDSERGCFAQVLSSPLKASGWRKGDGLEYVYEANGVSMTFYYNDSNGQFTCTSGCEGS